MKTVWIDQNILNDLGELQSESAADFISEVIDTFLKSSESLPARIASWVQKRDAGAMAREAHALKSSAFSIGATELGKLCQELEELGKQESLDSSLRTARLLLETLEKTNVELQLLKHERALEFGHRAS